MPTHQSLGGGSDEDLLRRMVATHPERYGDAFWAYFAAHVAARLPPRPVVLDIGCGPGLFLRDLAARYAPAALYGYDVTPGMIAHARQVRWPGVPPVLAVHDITTAPLPHDIGTAHLVSMTAVLHVIDEPLPVLAEIQRVLAPGGVFLLHDWIRQPLASYLAWRRDVMGEEEAESLRRGFRLFPVHNKYTTGDWHWLLDRAGFAIRAESELRPAHRIFVSQPAAPP